MSLLSRRGTVPIGLVVGLPAAGLVTALLVAAGLSPWAIAAIAAAGAALGGLSVFLGQRLWAARLLRQQTELGQQLHGLTDAVTALGGDVYFLQQTLQRQFAIGRLGEHVPPAPPVERGGSAP